MSIIPPAVESKELNQIVDRILESAEILVSALEAVDAPSEYIDLVRQDIEALKSAVSKNEWEAKQNALVFGSLDARAMDYSGFYYETGSDIEQKFKNLNTEIVAALDFINKIVEGS